MAGSRIGVRCGALAGWYLARTAAVLVVAAALVGASPAILTRLMTAIQFAYAGTVVTAVKVHVG